ncbi:MULTISPECIES: hypothetical protein [Pseudomonas syringae group]|uniref:hypothetical protein n=1 Tax=Pseudomonas syringae group TaxID=136849 RepID=UPI000F3BD117|nr:MULTISPECIES: hypothetical protein [Pseudomonas syringae group]MBI6848636.1 hypothetical protein [Pseudomonas syringae]RMV04190.1 putative phage protein [Pseudomonas syringae pv. tomato]TES52354.1 hypothetical protein E2N91_29910 [Pseudomonas syringae pv. tomato]
MSWLDGMLDDSEAASQDQRLERTSERLAPTFFEGGYDSLGKGLVRGAIEGGAAAESTYWNAILSGGPEQNIFDYTQSTTLSQESQQKIGDDLNTLREETASAVMDLRPDPAEVGIAGQIIGEAAAILPRAVIGAVAAGPAGAAIAAGAPAGYSRRAVSMAEGIDENTATLLGLSEGVVTGAGAILPAAQFVKPVLGDAAIAIGANVGLGMAHRGTAAALLDSNGYAAQAAQYRAMDGTAIATDAILGAAFFGIGRASMRRPTTDQVDAALTERNAQHADIDTAPGLPVDPRSAIAHQDALRAAIEQINRGEAVVLPDNIQSATFLRTPEDFSVVAPSRAEALITAREELAPVLRNELQQDAAGTIPNVKDVRAELANLSKSLDGLDESFRARAKEFQQQGQSRKQAESAARQSIADERTQLTDRQTALNESLDGNRSAEMARADLNALDRGEAPARFEERVTARADEIIQGFQRKPLAAGVAEARLTPRQINERSARDELDTLVREHEATLPRDPVDVIVSADAGRADAQAADAVAPGGKADQVETETLDVAATEPNSRPSRTDAGAEPPELQMLRGAVARNPDAMVRTGFAEDGTPTSVRAADALEEIEAEYRAGVQDAQAYNAAIGCLLRL